MSGTTQAPACPNGCGPMHVVPFGHQCAKCGWPCVPVRVNLLDLDAVKAAGLNSAEHSARLLAEHYRKSP